MKTAAAGIIALLTALPAAAQRWELQSNFWVSLHQTMLDAAQNGKALDVSMTDDERSAWNNAVHEYRIRFYERSPIFDDELVRINDGLTTAGELPPEGFAEIVTKALLSAAPVYRKHRWADDDRANKFWISVAEGMLRDTGEELVREHSRVYGAQFPSKIRVDVSPAAGATGAYATVGSDGLVHVTISSRDQRYQGYAGLEMLLHEASHAIVGAATGPIGAEIQNVARNNGMLAPRELWHAIIFYTSGELARRVLRARGITDYVPYIYKQSLFDRGFSAFKQPLETFWQSYLEGRMDRGSAITAIVKATGTLPPSRVRGL
jgi:hypothetical protein